MQPIFSNLKVNFRYFGQYFFNKIKRISEIKFQAQTANVACALFVCILLNGTFSEKIIELYSSEPNGFLHIAAVLIINSTFTYLILAMLAFGLWQKSILILILLISASLAYFIDEFGIVVDTNMITNVISTDSSEALDLLSGRLILNIIVFGCLPSFLIIFLKIETPGLKKQVLASLKGILVSVSIILCTLLMFSQFFSSFLREHKPLRYYSNPIFPIYSLIKHALQETKVSSKFAEEIGVGTKIPDADHERDLVIFVLGETARGENFSLNGYSKKTNPLLEQENVVSFSNFYSCGTSTAVSVPCMFSVFGREKFSQKKATQTQNLVDVLYNTNDIDVLWRDNNSNSKGVALRVPYQSFKTSSMNKVCDVECRDIGMLDGLQEFISSSAKKDIFIVLHQMGNHGPAYYKRYPAAFDKFKPSCQHQELDKCTKEEIVNAYDNAILYTDYFLSQVIQLLKKNDNKFETAMVYISDHGESLGENGIYLHGLPYSFAPEQQKKVGAVFWLGPGMKEHISMDQLRKKKSQYFTHDNVFHSVLGLFELESSVYNADKDLFR